MRRCITANDRVAVGFGFFNPDEPFKDREVENRGVVLGPGTGANLGLGTYSTTAHLLGMSIGFVF